MRILHISDFHFKKVKKVYEQNKLVEALLESLRGKAPIDFVFFTGDLVHSGSDYEDFEGAHERMIEPLCARLNLSLDKIAICAGNHDIDRAACSEAIITHLDGKISDNYNLNEFKAASNIDFKTSLNPSANFYKYFKKHYGSFCGEHSELHSIQFASLEGKKIAIVTINTAWLSSGFREDLNKLLFPTEIVKKAVDIVDGCDLKVLLLHHPLSQLKEFNHSELQNIIHSDFHLMFSGHVHRGQMATHFNARNGIFWNTAQAALAFDGGQIGYSIVEYDLRSATSVNLEISHYIKDSQAFASLSKIFIPIPCGEDKQHQNRLREKITSKFETELENANLLLLDYDESSKRSFLDTFSTPVLSKKADNEPRKSTAEDLVSFDENLLVCQENYLVFGRDKSGKTALLRKIQLHLLKKYGELNAIPFFLDYKEAETKYTQPLNFVRNLANYYQINQADAANIIKQQRLVLLIDNLDPTLISFHKQVVCFLSEHPNVNFIICSDQMLSRMYAEELSQLKYEKLFIKNLTRKEIRHYTQLQPNIKSENQDEVLDRILRFSDQLQLPLNYWTISLIFLIYKKMTDDYTKNLFGILDMCVDEILRKKQNLLERSQLKFEQYKELCSQIAHFLLTEHQQETYCASHQQIIDFIAEYTRRNPRIDADSRTIFDFLFEVGLLKKKDNDKYSFRLNGIFEYFLAYYTKENPDFKAKILSDDSIYLVFRNELEIYSGFQRKDETFLRLVFEKTKNALAPINANYGQHITLDHSLVTKIGVTKRVVEVMQKIKINTPVDPAILDSIKDEINPLFTEAEVQLKRPVDVSQISPVLFERYLFILARVFKNLDSIENPEFINEIFDYLLETYCNLSFYLVDEMTRDLYEEKLVFDMFQIESEDEKQMAESLLATLTNWMPFIVSANLYEGVGDRNMTSIIRRKIGQLKVDPHVNQYKLFLLYFLLMDIDLKNIDKYVDEVFTLVSLPVLKVATHLKLTFYMAFKAYNNEGLKKILPEKIKQAQLRLDSEIDWDQYQRKMAIKEKEALVTKMRNI